MTRYVNVYTDGTVTKNPGGSGRGGYVIEGTDMVIQTKTYHNTTSNRMELMGAIQALIDLNPDSCVHIHTDSQYVIKVASWCKRVVRDQRNKPNLDLCICLQEAMKLHADVKFSWVKGHSGNYYNEMVDRAISQNNQSLKW